MNAYQMIRMALLQAEIKLTMDKTYPKDPNPENWRTIQGSKVHLTNGKIDGGAGGKFMGNEWHGKKPHGLNSFFPPKGWTPKKEPEKKQEWGNPPKSIINKLAGKYKNASAEVKEKVDEAFKDAKAGVYFENLSGTDESELFVQTMKAWQDKKITKLAAQNVLATLESGNKVLTAALIGNWSDPSSPLWEPSTPKVAKKSTPKPLTAAALGEKKTWGKPTSKVVDLADTLDYDNLTTSKQQQIKKIIMKSGLYKNGIPTDAVLTKELDISPGEKDTIKLAKSILHAYHTGECDYYDTLHVLGIIKAKKTGTIDELITAWKYGKTGGNKTPLSKIDAILQTEGPKAKAAGLFLTPNTCSVDLSEKATGIKTPKGTLQLVAAKGTMGDATIIDPAFENFKADQAKQFAKLSKKTKEAILRYTQGSKHTRDWLVYGIDDPAFHDNHQKYPPFVKYGMTGKVIQEECDAISDGLQKMKHPDMWITRDCSLMDWATKTNPNGLTFAELANKAKNGEVFENEAFLSGSPSEVPTFSNGGKGEVVRIMYVPKKASGGYIDSGSEYSSDHGFKEYEFLLDKGAKTRIMKVEQKNGIIYTYEEVLT